MVLARVNAKPSLKWGQPERGPLGGSLFTVWKSSRLNFQPRFTSNARSTSHAHLVRQEPWADEMLRIGLTLLVSSPFSLVTKTDRESSLYTWNKARTRGEGEFVHTSILPWIGPGSVFFVTLSWAGLFGGRWSQRLRSWETLHNWLTLCVMALQCWERRGKPSCAAPTEIHCIAPATAHMSSSN